MLQLLGNVTLRIEQGIDMVDEYLLRASQMSDPWIKHFFGIDGFTGDLARKKLQRLYRDNLDQDDNICSCYK
jgi:hypothetical protein